MWGIQQITLEYGQIAIGYVSEGNAQYPWQGIAGAVGTFIEQGINIPFPHRDVIFKTPVQVESGPQS